MPAFDALSMMTEALEASCGARINTLIPCEIRFSHCATCLEASLSVTCTRSSMPAFFASASMVCRSFTQRSSRWVGSESPILGPAASARAATSTPAHAARSPTDALIRFPPLLFAAIVFPSRKLVRDSTASTTLRHRQARFDARSRLRVYPPRQLQLHLQPSFPLPRLEPVLRCLLVPEGERHAGRRAVHRCSPGPATLAPRRIQGKRRTQERPDPTAAPAQEGMVICAP